MALRFFGRWGFQFALRGIAFIPADLTENVVQIMLLNGHENVVWLKATVTPLKLGLFFLGLTIAIVGLCAGLGRRFLESGANPTSLRSAYARDAGPCRNPLINIAVDVSQQLEAAVAVVNRQFHDARRPVRCRRTPHQDCRVRLQGLSGLR